MKKRTLTERAERLLGDAVAIVTASTLSLAYRISKRFDPDDSKWGARSFGSAVLTNWMVTHIMRKKRDERNDRED